MPSQEAEDISKAGITTSSDGSRYIPSSVRADGSVRKEIKVKPGYRPPEDIEKYKNRTAEAFRNRGKGGVLGAELVDDGKKEAGLSGAAAKNAKRKEARRKAAAENAKKDEEGDGKENLNGAASPIDIQWNKEPIEPEVEKQKEAKKLAKKLRQARELKDKKESGAALLPEQFEKVIKINELIRQLDALGFDSQGEKKGYEEAGTASDEKAEEKEQEKQDP